MKDQDNPIVVKSKAFGIRMTRLRTYLVDEKHEYEISKQVLRSGTSIGANVKEAIRGQSKADFGAKMNIALKEASETEHWLEMLYEGQYINKKGFDSIIKDCHELIRILTSIVKTTFKGKDR
ncbi:MAG: four helix bundle protein [Muribaculaceae bacterium]|nr:four helix bundle protein [Muribaculaceae bacterium]